MKMDTKSSEAALPTRATRRRSLDVKGGRRSAVARRGIVPYLYLAPAAVLFLFFILKPLVDALFASLTDARIVGQAHFVGFDNYVRVFSSETVRQAFLNSFILIFFFSVLPIIWNLFVVSLIARARIKGMSILRLLLFLPQVLAGVVVGIAWNAIYAPSGPINSVLKGVGLSVWTRPWLGDFDWALVAVGVVGFWISSGLVLVLLLSGVQKIPEDYYEASMLDGAGSVRQFFAITFPGIRSEIAVAATLTTTAAFSSFSIIFITTRGGPGTTTYVPTLILYQDAFQDFAIGRASAVGVVVTGVALVVTWLVSRIGGKEE